MIDKTIGVIPSRNELSSFSDKKTESSKDQKSEFESYFKQLNKKDSDDVSRGNKKSTQSSEKKLADKPEKTKEHEDESDKLEVVKKKKIKLEDTETVLNGMASLESAIKTPDSEDNLDRLETTNSEIQLTTKLSVDDLKNQSIEPLLAQPVKVEQPLDAPVIDAETISAETSAMQQLAIEPDSAMDGAIGALQGQVVAEAEIDIEPETNKILETLNREQLFQKLESLAQPEVAVKSAVDASESQVELKVAVQQPETAQDKSNAQSEDNLNQQNQSDSGALGSQPVHSLHAGVTNQHGKDFSASMASVNKAEGPAQNAEDANLKEILSQARYLVTKGGGEVSVKMSPEGMGEVHLKMMLENGKMSVEMHTQDKNVQKLIQDSLSDLKSSLAAHQISVEHVTLNNKINTVQDMQQSADSRNSSDSGRHAQAGENSFAHFQNNENSARQQHQARENKASIHQDGIPTLPLTQLNDVKKATAHKVYQSHKAQSLNAVA